MRILVVVSLLLAACLAAAAWALSRGDEDGEREPRQGLRLHPENPRYLLFRGKSTVLITSGEHYGAVINADFDYVRYLNELARFGFNQTRLFSGTYIEAGGRPRSSGGSAALALGYDNTLAPRHGRFVSPWVRSGKSGKFDLSEWNPAYFKRLEDFVTEAGQRGIVVELVLFSAVYDFPSWRASPFHAANNVNGVGGIEAERLYTLDNGGVLEFQDALVRKLVAELRSFDNLYYEVINEGWAKPAPASDGWQDHIIETIEDAESRFPQRHLIARNYRENSREIPDPHPSVSIFNFHYQRDVGRYDNLEGVLAFDETGVQGTGDDPYRTDAWFFMLSGGGVYSHLDFSFTPDAEDGSFDVPDVGAGGGSPSLRRSLAVLKRFLERFDLPQMTPAHEIVTGAPPGTTTRALANPGTAYAIYLSGGRPGPLVLNLAPGRYRVEWIDTKNGAVKKRERLDFAAPPTRLTPPAYAEDIAVAIEAK